jgi:hypothetical protein
MVSERERATLVALGKVMVEVTVGGGEGEIKYPLSPNGHFKSRQCRVSPQHYCSSGCAAHLSGNAALPRQLKRWDCKACYLSYG